MTRAGVTDKTHDHEKYSNLVCLGSAIYQVSQQVLDRITYELREGDNCWNRPSFSIFFVKDSNIEIITLKAIHSKHFGTPRI